MKKMWLIIAGFAGVLFIIYHAHVPFYKWSSDRQKPEDHATYARLDSSVDGERFLIERLDVKDALHIFFDPATQQYLIVVELDEQPNPETYSEYHLIVLNQQGQQLEIRPIRSESIWEMEENPSIQKIARLVGNGSNPFTFAADSGGVELVHYQFLEFTGGLEVYYFIPVINSGWKGTAFMRLLHEGEVFKLQVSTEFEGGLDRSEQHVDGRIYHYTRAGETSGLGFLQIDESYYLSGMNGVDTHRDNYGLYLIRPKE